MPSTVPDQLRRLQQDLHHCRVYRVSSCLIVPRQILPAPSDATLSRNSSRKASIASLSVGFDTSVISFRRWPRQPHRPSLQQPRGPKIPVHSALVSGHHDHVRQLIRCDRSRLIGLQLEKPENDARRRCLLVWGLEVFHRNRSSSRPAYQTA